MATTGTACNVSAEARFEKLWASWRKASHRQEVAWAVIKKGAPWSDAPYLYATKAQQDRLSTADRSERTACGHCFAWLDQCSPRKGWRQGVPLWWVRERLTYNDAITAGPLSEVPPPAYGSTPGASVRFAKALA